MLVLVRLLAVAGWVAGLVSVGRVTEGVVVGARWGEGSGHAVATDAAAAAAVAVLIAAVVDVVDVVVVVMTRSKPSREAAAVAVAVEAVVSVVTRSEPRCEACVTATNTTKAVVPSTWTSDGVASILDSVPGKCITNRVTSSLSRPRHPILSSRIPITITIPSRSGKLTVPIASAASKPSLTCTIAANELLLILLLSNNLVAVLIDIPSVWTTCNRPRHAGVAQLCLFGFDFRQLELDLLLGVGEDAVVARGVRLFWGEWEAVAKLADGAGRAGIGRGGGIG